MTGREGTRRRGRGGHAREGRGGAGLPEPLPPLVNPLPPLELIGQDQLMRIVDAAYRVLEEAGYKPGHIFNLGHGILPNTPVENAIAVIEQVHQRTPG